MIQKKGPSFKLPQEVKIAMKKKLINEYKYGSKNSSQTRKGTGFNNKY